MSELSIFVDESGDAGETSRYYLITLVLHDQAEPLDAFLVPYENDLRNKGLRLLPLHVGPLLNGNDDYRNLDVSTRKSYLNSFRIMAPHLPFSYKTLAYEKSQFADSSEKLLLRMKRDLTAFLFDNLEYLRAFDIVKVYYDNGQAIVTKAIHDAIEYVLAKDAIIYRDAKPEQYRLLQLADYLCTLELTAVKYRDGCATKTDKIFFGEWGSFKRNYLKKLRRKRLQ